LVAAGDVARADAVFRRQLKDGRLFLEKAIPIRMGQTCIREFVRDGARQRWCEETLSGERVSHYLRMAGLYSLLAGDTNAANDEELQQPDEASGDPAFGHLLPYAPGWGGGDGTESPSE
jgi:hypothetical protein